MTDLIKTERLILRRHTLADAATMAELIGDWEVVKWLTQPPYPYTLADAEWFLNDPMSSETFAITRDDRYLGNVGLHGRADEAGLELGYWLGTPFHGQGLMSEAARAVVADHFAHSDVPLFTGYLLGNDASANVLTKLGCTNIEQITRRCVSQGKDLPLQRMVLTSQNWRKSHG